MISNVDSFLLGRFPIIQKILRALFLCFVVAILIPEGSVKATPLYLIAVPIFGLAVAASLLGRREPQHGWLYRVGFGVVVALVLWCLAQAASFEGNPFANSVWSAVSEALGHLPGSISIVPADTIAAIIPVTLPFAIFLTGLILFNSDDSATFLLRVLAVSGGVVAIAGIIQFELFPEYLMFRKKEFYLQDLTAVLVNRNSIATYLGAAVLLNAGFLYDSLLPLAPRSGWGAKVFYVQNNMRITGRSLLHGAMLLATLVALLLTRSRGGVGSTLVALLALSCFFVFDGNSRIRFRSRRAGPEPVAGSTWGIWLLAAGVIFAIFGILGGRVLLRADVQGGEDERFCAYQSMIQLLQDNWRVGTGLGTFREAYPRYQSASCGGNDALWDRAHSLYLEGWIDLGVIFLPLLLIVVGGLFVAFITGLKKRKALRWAPATGAAVLLLFLLHSAVDFSIQIPGVAVYFAAIMAGSAVLSLNRRRT